MASYILIFYCSNSFKEDYPIAQPIEGLSSTRRYKQRSRTEINKRKKKRIRRKETQEKTGHNYERPKENWSSAKCLQIGRQNKAALLQDTMWVGRAFQRGIVTQRKDKWRELEDRGNARE